MTENTCTLGNDHEELLLGYLYEELDPATRETFSAHLQQCGVCRSELDSLRAVRRQLEAWTPPNFSNRESPNTGRRSAVAGQASGANHQPDGVNRERWWQAVPAWAQVAAALLFLGVAAGLANLNVHYDASGLTVRTGWLSAATAAPSSDRAVAPNDSAPWRADLTALERRLETEMHAPADAAHAVSAVVRPPEARADAETLRRVRAMLDDSERKQQRELALRVAEVMHDVDTQRRADLVRISQSLGQLQSNTGMEVMKQRQLLNYLVSVSQKP